MKSRGIVGLAALLLLSAACMKKGRFEASAESGSQWHFHRGTVGSTGADTTGSFSGKLRVIWQRKQNDKAIGPLTLSGGGLFYTGSRKKVKIFDPATGATLAQIKARGPAQSGAVRADSLLFYGVGPLRNELVGYNLHRGREIWETPIKDVSGGSILCKNRLIVSSSTDRIACFETSDGREVWSSELEGSAVAPPSLSGSTVYQPTDAGKVYALDADRGTKKFVATVGKPIVSAVAVGEKIWVTDIGGAVSALDTSDGRIGWRAELGGPIWSSPAVADGRVIAASSAGSIAAFDAGTGAELWRYEAVDVIRAAPIVVGQVALAATMSGKLISLSAVDGRLIDTLDVHGPVRIAPITDGKRVYVATDWGRLTCVGDDYAAEHTTGNSGAVEHRP